MGYEGPMATCPTGREFQGEEAAARAEGRGMDLTALWKAAGRPRGRSPRHWLAGTTYGERVRDEGGGPDGRSWPTTARPCSTPPFGWTRRARSPGPGRRSSWGRCGPTRPRC